MFMISLVRAQVRMEVSGIRALVLSMLARAPMKAGKSSQGREGWTPLTLPLRRVLGSKCSR
jgi:hypothetical protein